MNTELIKRLKEAAEKYQEKYETTERVAFTHGAVWGYKEAIEAAKEWLAVRGVFGGKTCGNLKQYITDFENNMNKILEED